MANTDPNRPEIVTRTLWGGKSAVALGGNRYSIKSEALYKAANAVALPARGLPIDAALWVAGYALAFRLPFSLFISGWLAPYMALSLVLLVLLPTLTWLSEVAKALPDHRGDSWARLVLVLAGLLVASNGFWVRGSL